MKKLLKILLIIVFISVITLLFIALFTPRNLPQAIPTATITPKPAKEIIVIDGENPGEYGKTVVINAETENQLIYIGYFLPAGKYIATNNKSTPNQLNIYNSETIWEDGIEYPGEGSTAVLIMAGESKEFEVPEGFYIKVISPSDFSIVQADQ